MAFLETMIGTNSIFQYLWVLAILIITFIGTRFVYFVVAKFISTLTKKTKTQLDDMLVGALRGPVVLAVLLVGVNYAKNVLTVSDAFNVFYAKAGIVLWIFNIAWFFIRLVDSLLVNYIHPLTKSSKSKIDDTIYPVVKFLVNFVIYAIAATVVMQNLGIEITGLMAGFGLGGLAFALAAQDILGNTFAGGAILIDKPFKVGDRLKVEGYDGFVKKISIRTTTLETFAKTQIIMPNSRIANNIVENVSREDRRREKVLLGVEYGTSTKKMKKAKDVLHKIVLKNDKTDNDSLIYFDAFGSSSLDLLLIYYIKDMDQILATRDEINFAIKDAFEKEKIEFAFPSQTVYVKK